MENKIKVQIVIDNFANEGFSSQHGLSLLLSFPSGEKLLFDTGSGGILLQNLAKWGVSINEISSLVISHGHYDHTGGLDEFLSAAPDTDVYYGKGMEKRRYSIHPDRPVKELTLPQKSAERFSSHPGKKYCIENFSLIREHCFLTGKIPHTSFEDRGGPFFLDKNGLQKDELDEELALLTGNGLLIQGCCHAGIINTLTHCQQKAPDIPVRFLIGGLHLLYADEEKLAKTAQYLNRIPSLEKIVLLHCTGEKAVEYLQKHLSCEVLTGKAGDCFFF